MCFIFIQGDKSNSTICLNRYSKVRIGELMNQSVLLNVTYKIKTGCMNEFINCICQEQIQELSAAENGNIEYTYTHEFKNDIVTLREIWKDKEAWRNHVQSAHFRKLQEIKNKYVEDTSIEERTIYIVDKCDMPVNGVVTVPGSKSMTNRALLLAALSKGKSHLKGVLFSDDSRHFLECLICLGFEICINEENKTVDIQGCGGLIPKKNGIINVGSAGTAARFLTAMLALSDGIYTINCSGQMKKRPMAELFRVLSGMGAAFEYLEQEGYLPVRVTGMGYRHSNKWKETSNISDYAVDNRVSLLGKEINMDISKSTQYLSALLMMAPVIRGGLKIHITSEKKDGSYIRITRRMLEQFGVKSEFDGTAYYVEGNQNISIGDYYVEPDVSAACYFYGIAAITGGSIIVQNVNFSSMQGDMKFITLLEKMGCTVEETQKGICVTGPAGGRYQGIDVDMNDFSDQALTLAALAAFAESDTRIRNIGHIRGQECNRMAAIVNELRKCGLDCSEKGNDIIISSGVPHGAIIDTYEDHRVAMAFTLLGLKVEGIMIDNPECCRKTFENYYDVLEQLLRENREQGNSKDRIFKD